MEKQNKGIVEDMNGRSDYKSKAGSEDARPVKWIQVGKNVWRVVYAD